ncbi:hypothetical protein [Ramlibacter tataouinensis]|uniref:Uncharacterized protein n=1 Tax=Ramlibacter tataouinensis (strain ATCC BAA-407 / DSM 14655 / LMG 21543 / TTB310) TaxID=365046 RepID=F5Y2B2_RAMTT|nr:hypothetical protein [Ramlibacter tataouinensis]AEG91086.1 Hypothetical protein Rta_00260 [Ramlibacter tataouinensis TTB310]
MAAATRSRPTQPPRGAPVAAPATLIEEEERRKTVKKKDVKEPPRVVADRPRTGRSTPLGRKTESPASIKTAGPSGQKGGTQHQKLHTNK